MAELTRSPPACLLEAVVEAGPAGPAALDGGWGVAELTRSPPADRSLLVVGCPSMGRLWCPGSRDC